MTLKAFQDPDARFFLTADAGGAAGAAGGASGADRGGNAGGSAGGAAGGAAGDPWYQPHVGSLDKDTLAYLDGKKFPSMLDALKSGAQSDKMARDRNVVARPDPAKLGEWEGWEGLGWNKDRGTYAKGIKPPTMPNNGKHDEALLDAFVGFAHDNRVPPAMAEKLFHGMNDFVNQRLSAAASDGIKSTEKMHEALRGEWKGEYDQRLELSTRAAKALGVSLDEATALEKFTGDAGLIKLFHRIGSRMGEANLVNADGLGGAGGLTPASAEAELRRIEADPVFLKSFQNSRDPGHEDAKAKWNKLVERAASGGQQRAGGRR